MNRSKPSTVVGGGEMKRDTSSLESMVRSEGASESRSSRSVTIEPVSTGSACRQSLVVVSAAAPTTSAFISTSTSPSR